jgi:hypothetical protein
MAEKHKIIKRVGPLVFGSVNGWYIGITALKQVHFTDTNRKHNYWQIQKKLSDYFESQSEAEIYLKEFI